MTFAKGTSTMFITIKKLTPALAEDFLTYFDHDAFADHEEWAGCYCLESHLSRDSAPPLDNKQTRREKAKELILSGVMTGYLLYDENKVVGWCNAGDKSTYGPVCAFDQLYTLDPQAHNIFIVYCIDIAADYRGKGLATLAVQRALEDAKAQGYAFAEGYPFSPGGESDVQQYPYTGPKRLYEKLGFTLIKQGELFQVMQKAL